MSTLICKRNFINIVGAKIPIDQQLIIYVNLDYAK